MLTDNGCEFADPEQLEMSKSGEQRTHIYYCDPRMSNQKGALEKNHEYIRYVLPKGTSFDNLTDETVLCIVNHINNTARPGLGSRTPMSLALQVFDAQVLKSLGLVTIPADEVCLTKALINK
jgi:IS30 family transposase